MRESETTSPTAGPLVLAVDTSSRMQGVALVSGGGVRALRWSENRRSHTETLVVQISELLEASGTQTASLTAVAAVTGPGSFTGIRIGMAAAFGMAESLGLPCFGAHSLELMARHPHLPDGPVMPVLQAGRGRLFAALYFREGGGVRQVVSPFEAGWNEAADRFRDLGSPFIVGQWDAEMEGLDQPGGGAGSKTQARQPATLVPPVLLLAALASELQGKGIAPGAPPEPFYIRPPDAKKPRRAFRGPDF